MIKMKTYYMKIRDKYIKEVRDGVKKHEYRLASPDRRAVRVGDNIILISNTDKKSYVRTTVKRITTYRDWKEALEKNWQNDFKNLYSTLEEALKECYRFYPKEYIMYQTGNIIRLLITLKQEENNDVDLYTRDK